MSEPSANIPADQPVPEAGVEPDGIDTPTLVMWGFVSVVITICLMLVAAALCFQAQGQFNATRVVAPAYFDAEKTLGDQRGVLASYGAPTSEGQPYKIPIDRAKDLVIDELQSERREN